MILGVCQAINKFEGMFDNNDVGILEIFARQAGIILTRSIMFNRTVTDLTKTKRVVDVRKVNRSLLEPVSRSLTDL